MKAKIFWLLGITTFVTPLLFLEGCGPVVGIAAAANRNNLNKLEVGMSKSEVRNIMGKPYQREASEQCEWWFYRTNVREELFDAVRVESDYTPLAFENNCLVGWGRNFYIDRTKRYDVKIDQTIKQR